MKKAIVTITDKQHKTLKLLSRVEGRPITEHIRSAIDKYLEDLENSGYWREFLELLEDREDKNNET